MSIHSTVPRDSALPDKEQSVRELDRGGLGLRPYPEYRDSGMEWIGSIAKHWEVWKFTHALKGRGSGTTPATHDLSYSDGGVPWVTTSGPRESGQSYPKCPCLEPKTLLIDNKSLDDFRREEHSDA